MPLYEYRCYCGRTTEAFRSIDARERGPVCHVHFLAGSMRRMVSPFVQLQPPTGAALRSHFRRAQEAGAELEHHGVSTAGLFQHAVQAAAEQPAIPPPD